MSDIDSYVAVEKGSLRMCLNMLDRGSAVQKEAAEELRMSAKDITDFFPKPEEINTGTITNSNKTKGISFAVVPDYKLPAAATVVAETIIQQKSIDKRLSEKE